MGYQWGMRTTLVACLLLAAALARAEAAPSGLHAHTDWELAPSLKLDALCLLNALSGDPYYLAYYRDEYEHFDPLFKPAERQAFRDLKGIIKDEGGGIVSARLTLLFSTLDGDGLADLLRAVDDVGRLRAAFRSSAFWDEETWRSYETSVRPALRTALRALERTGLEAYWNERVRPRLARRIEELRPRLPRYDIVPAIESRLGKALPSERITVYVLAWSEPHGIRLSGSRFITHVSYPFEIVLRNAIHEMLHPPYDATRPCVVAALGRLAEDPTIQAALARHDPSSGYNELAGYVDEDSVQALEAVLDERFGVGRDQRAYWKEQDGGMHVLALALYELLSSPERAAKAPLPYEAFFCSAVETGALGAAALARAAAELR